MTKQLPGVFLAISLLWGSAEAQSPQAARLFDQSCTSCHSETVGKGTPDATTLRQMTPEAVYEALSKGAAHAPARQLSDADRRSIGEYLGGRNFMDSSADASTMPNVCAANPPITSLSAMPAWNGWGVDSTNGRFQQAKAAGIAADQVPRLKLKWAFGFPGATAVHGQPAVAAGRVFVGLNNGYVYSLDAATGCVYWSFQARAGVRNAISIGEVKGQGSARYAVYFGDVRANVYALDAAMGKQLWKIKADEHGLAGITGAPALYEGRLYVPVASREELTGVSLNYPCCTFRGSVVALDANTGRQIWKTYVIPDPPKPVKKNSVGTQLWTPSGGAVWNTPTIDPKQHALYVGTGNAYTQPAQERTDAVLALDLDTGKVRWVVQDTPKDAWLVCSGVFGKSENCPEDIGPDYDFGASPILRTVPNGHRVLVAGQKSGMIWGHDPDRNGAVVWKVQIPEKLAIGEITFGGAADDQYAYFGVSSAGVAAVDLATGEKKWLAPIKAAGPRLGIGAALTV
ncbi:MAG TPA: PQQ-binding-like beta-propeller repeat protein, partial [Bryobacteraceae bacterium]|nr:PQQ-binding-like beta-propeller repeat protein [Bryobacteraceae bacterium]